MHLYSSRGWKNKKVRVEDKIDLQIIYKKNVALKPKLSKKIHLQLWPPVVLKPLDLQEWWKTWKNLHSSLPCIPSLFGSQFKWFQNFWTNHLVALPLCSYCNTQQKQTFISLQSIDKIHIIWEHWTAIAIWNCVISGICYNPK